MTPTNLSVHAHRVWRFVSGDDAVRPVTIASWAMLCVVLVLTLQSSLRFEFLRHHTLVGDQASYVMQTETLVGGHDLSYDTADMERWRSIGWTPAPNGLFFQRHDHGWAFAKPYGYSAYLTPFVAALGTVRGLRAANSLLLVGLVVVSIAIVRLRYRGPVVPLLVGTFYFAAYPVFYTYLFQPELLLALLVGAVFWLLLLAWRWRALWPAVIAFTGMGFALSEKAPMIALFLAPAVVTIWNRRRIRDRVLLPVVAIAAFVIASIPYVYYSNGRTWNAYGGLRYFSNYGQVPFDGTSTTGWIRWKTSEAFTPHFVAHALTSDLGDKVKSSLSYLVGRDTGLLVFLPVGFLVLMLALTRLGGLDWQGWAVLLGVVGYVVFYLVLFPRDYQGSGGLLGNRYFLQVAPSLVALAVAARVPARNLIVAALVGAVAGLVFLWPQFDEPSTAYLRPTERSWLRARMPRETNLDYINAFVCNPPVARVCQVSR